MNINIFPFIFVFFSFLFSYSFIFWLRWVFVAASGLSLVAVSGGYSLLQYAGFSLRWFLLLQSRGSRHVGSVAVARGLSSCGTWTVECRLSSCGACLSCSAACGIFPDQVSNPCPLHWQADS